MTKVNLTLAAMGLTNTQKTAIGVAGPIIKAWLRKIIRIYKRATPEQRAWLIAHNSILAALAEVFDEENS